MKLAPDDANRTGAFSLRTGPFRPSPLFNDEWSHFTIWTLLDRHARDARPDMPQLRKAYDVDLPAR